jgi:membrane protease YdiL (CAAX protease family)
VENNRLSRRFNAWIRDFLPENLPQLVFPLASLLIFIGTTYTWYPPQHTLANYAAQSGQPDLWFDFTSRWIQATYYVTQYAMWFVLLASIWLWSVPVEVPLRRFNRWVLLPVGLVIAVFLALVLLGESPPASVLDRASSGLHTLLWRFLGRLLTLGNGFYLTLLGTAMLIAALRMVAAGKVQLPLRFRNQTAEHPPGTVADSGLARRVMLFVVVASILVTIDVFLALLPGRMLTWSEGIAHFPIVDWLVATVDAALLAVCALVLLRQKRNPSALRILRLANAREAARAVAVSLLIIFIPRLALGIFQQWGIGSDHVQNLPSMWWELLVPSPVPALLLVLVTAFFQEVVLRGLLQSQLTDAVGLKRAIFLVALIAVLLPLYWGGQPYDGIRHSVIGVSTLIHVAVRLLYGVLLGWFFARTGSTLVVTLSYGTIVLFHRGSGDAFYLNHPGLFWMEMACLLFAGWFLFKRFPPAQATPAIPSA